MTNARHRARRLRAPGPGSPAPRASAPRPIVARERPGLVYDPRFVSPADRAEILAWLATIRPLWEERYSRGNPPPPGTPQRRLLRPVYWLGNWQFACLDYYRPPKGIHDRCVAAEPFPPPLQRIANRAEALAQRRFRGVDLPRAWRLNTCLVNLYGDRIDAGARADTARVGEHKDFEPGPVASVSLGERALFQFVSSQARGDRARVLLPQWLDDGSLLVFGGELWKQRAFHRVLRVDRRGGFRFPPEVDGFETRRVNFTFRYVPDEHVVPFARLSVAARDDVRGYVGELAKSSPFFAEQLARETRGER